MSLIDKLKEIEIKPHGFQYRDFLDNGGIVISPSGLRNFIESPSAWKTNTVDKIKTFSGNLNTQMGSYIHLYAEYYYNNRLTKENKLPKVVKDAFFEKNQDIDLGSYIDKKNTIRMDNYLDLLCEALREEYLEIYTKPLEWEQYFEYKITDDVMIAGSYDALSEELAFDGSQEELVMVDFKSTGTTLNEKSLLGYILQLSVYCQAYKNLHSREPTRIRIVAIVKTQKPKIQILECKPNYELAKRIVNDSYNAIRFTKGEDLTREEYEALIFKENIYSFTMNEEQIKKIIGEVSIITGGERQVKKIVKSVFG